MANQWLMEFEEQIAAKTAHTFLLHGNMYDDVLYEAEFLRWYHLLPKLNSFRRAGIVAFFNLASGVRFADEKMKQAFFELIIQPILEALGSQMTPEAYFEAHKREIREVIAWFDTLLAISWEDAEKFLVKQGQKDSAMLPEYIKEHKPKKTEKGSPFACVVFEYQQSKTPPESGTGSSALDRMVVETFQWWAQLPEIRKTNNLIVLISKFLTGVDRELYDQSNGIIPISVPLPDREEQKETIDVLEQKGIFVPVRGDKDNLSNEEIARLAAGLSRVEVQQIFRQAKVHKEDLSAKILFEKKARIIEARLGDVVRVKKPAWGWESIGGMDDRVAFALIWAEAMNRQNVARMPKGGILLMGAPGTGKTVYAEAFAHELDMPFLEVMNTFNQFVGVSEQNMQNLLDTAWAMRPCILFFDEIEQLLLPRGEVYHGDSGVFARSSRMLMQFFSDPRIHGQVVIFAATNRPDLLDEAMKRAGRFGARIPFLVPQKKDRPSIWKALLRKEVIRLSLVGIRLDISQVVDDDKLIEELSGMADFWDDDGLLKCGPPDEKKVPNARKYAIPMTGAEMEDIIGLSFQPFLSPDELDSFRMMDAEERVSFLLKRFPMNNQFVLNGEALKRAMQGYLPHENVRAYKAMDELALLSVNSVEYIPREYQDEARRLRIRRQKERERQERS